MSPPILDIDLALPPAERWRDLHPYRDAVRELVASYVRDLGGLEPFRAALQLYRAQFVASEYAAEVDSIASIAGVDALEVLLANVYYDAFKHVMGCTAYALDTPTGPIHARNLDWWTERSALSRTTIVGRFHRAGIPVFEAVTWPGFVGVLSGMAPGRFSVTLNAVLSDEPASIAAPVGLVLRDLLTRASFSEAVTDLETRSLACDCLLLVCGVENGQMCVIERTPTRSAVRGTDSGAIVVTNDYRSLIAPGWSADGTTLQATSCARYDRASWRVHAERPASAADCFAILNDRGIKMDITVQQMVMSAKSGALAVRAGKTVA